MAQPVIFVVDDDPASLTLLRAELSKRYAADYQVVCESSAVAGLNRLAEMKEDGQEVAVLLADCIMPEMPGEEFLDRAQVLHPQARRGLLINFSDRGSAQSVLRAMAVGQIDSYGPKPLGPADEAFHHFVTTFLHDWTHIAQRRFEMVRVVGEQWAPRCHELRDLLNRNDIPYGFYDVNSERGREILAEAGAGSLELPVTVLFNGQALANPSNQELASALHENTIYDLTGVPEDEVVDTVIAGAGPAGLSAAVYAASEGLHTVVVEREAIGGQAGKSANIRNYLGFPTGIRGDELASRAYRQAWLFGADFTFTQEAVALKRDGNLYRLALSGDTEVTARSVVLAMGVSYRPLGIPSLDRFTGAGVFYGSATSEARAMTGETVCIVGGGNSAGQAAIHLSSYAREVILVTMDSSLQVSMSEYLIAELTACNNIQVRVNSTVSGGGGDGRLGWLEIQNVATGEKETIRLAALFVQIGATPHTAWLPDGILRDEQGFILTGRDLVTNVRSVAGRPTAGWLEERDPYPLETSLPGVFAIGDVRYGSVKRVASAAGDGSIVVAYLHQYLVSLPV